MDKMVGWPVLVLLVISLQGCIADEPDSNLLITRASREVVLSSPVVEQSVTLSLQNEGSNPISYFLFTVDSNLAKNLAYIVAETKGKDAVKLTMQETSIKSQPEVKTYRITLPSPLGTQETVSVIVKSVFTHSIKPHPLEITQMDKQLVQFVGNAYVLTPYRCKTQNTDFTLPSSNIESYTRVSPVSTDGSIISYGPYSDTAPYSHFRITLHYENNGPFLGIVSLERLIQVSHWGVIQVEEHVHVRHIGAVLKGSFSRFDYQRNPNSGQSSVKSYVSLLPAAAEDVYYRDEIGNISTSHLRDGEDYMELTIRPRFPLFGGWQTRYYIGYNVPTYEYLFHTGSHYILKMRFVDHVFDDQIVDELITRIILPEGSKNIELKTPYKVNEETRETHHTYLDTVGRPVVVAKGYNLVEQHIQDFELYYDFESYLLLQEPLLLVGALLLFFFIIIFVVRLDFSISKDVNAVARQLASAAKESITSASDSQFRISKKILSAIDSFKKNKDVKSFKTTFSELSKRYKDHGKIIEEQSEQLKDTDALKIFKKSSAIFEALNHLQQLADQVVNGRLKQDQYVREEESTRKKLVHLEDEIEAMVQRL